MVKATEEEYKNQLISLLERVHRICDEYGLRYTIAFGTLLGAVRHKGFIPWDDDVDICMPREDYQVFSKVFTSDDGRYYTLDSRNSKYYYNCIYRVCDGDMVLPLKDIPSIDNLGAFIDIFVLDRWPTDEIELDFRYEEIRKQVKNLRLALPIAYCQNLTIRQKISRIVRFPSMIYYKYLIGFKKLRTQLDQLVEQYNSQDTGWRMVSSDNPRLAPWFIREDDLDRRVLLPFENLMVYAPENYDELLTKRYGNYKQFPPEEQRITHHHFTPYWRNERK
ncbi:MAG: LicD family protein [Eubacterium sp.]|nr:LicD family protein [Eubacterium sp.]